MCGGIGVEGGVEVCEGLQRGVVGGVTEAVPDDEGVGLGGGGGGGGGGSGGEGEGGAEEEEEGGGEA